MHLKHQTARVFEEWAEHYDTDRVRTPYFQAQLRIALSMLGDSSGRVLDIGCAAGGEVAELRARKFSVVGIDISPQMLLFAHRRFADDPHVHFCRADAERLPFKSQSMDHVMCLGVFEFLPDHAAAAREIYRVLRPGGMAVFAIPTSVSLYALSDRLVAHSVGPMWRRLKRLLGGKSIPEGFGFERNLCVPWRFRSLLREVGFDPQRSAYSNFFVYPLDRVSENLNMRGAAMLEPLRYVPLLRWAGAVYMVSARKEPA
jgi:ubiquinone/menaquinone biosynthesis C-methylase UbiE